MSNAEFQSIYKAVAAIPAFSDHDHHNVDEFFAEGMSLEKIMCNSYVNWTGFRPDGTVESRRRLLDNVRFNSYFTWLEKSLQMIYGIDEPITVENWELFSGRIAAAHAADKDFHWKLFKQYGFDRLILDTYWEPGQDNGHSEVFVPTFRIDKFMYCYHPDAIAPNDFVPWKHYGFKGRDIDELVELMCGVIRRQHGEGKVAAMKCAEAYCRSIDFLPDDRTAAAEAFMTPPEKITPRQRLLFSNYIFNRACELAAELDVPFQVHTGLAELSGSEPMKLEGILRRHERTRFVLFHSGFPWTHQVAGLAHNYANALPSLTWTATICTSAAVRALHDYIDVARSINTITWGSDCWTAEESVSALLAWRFIVATVLAERFADGRLRGSDVDVLARKLMRGNGEFVYKR